MKVGFNARLLYSPELRGWNRYTVNLVRELVGLGVEAWLYSDRGIHPEHLAGLPRTGLRFRQKSLKYPLWEQLWLPSQCRLDGVELLHAPCNFGLPWTGRFPKLLTLHDVIDRAYSGKERRLSQRLAPRALQSELHHWIARSRAARLITVSQFSKSDMMRIHKIPSERISVIYEAADPIFSKDVPPSERARTRQSFGLLRPYCFYVGGWERRKNLPFLLKAFAEANLASHELVLAGGTPQQMGALESLAKELRIHDRIRFLNWVPDADLPALYQEAACFAYPSEYEGFGLQLCEAMASGCPTLAADATSLPEILKTGGETFSLKSPSELAQLLKKLTVDKEFQSQMRKRARERSLEFSWRATARRTLDLYEEVLRRNSTGETI